MRIKGEVNVGETEKTEKEEETEKLTVPPAPCRCLFRHQPVCLQKGPVKEGAP